MDYPDPLVFEPLQLPHKQTFILLHGRGSWAEKFGPELLRTPIQNTCLSSSGGNKNNPLIDWPLTDPQAHKAAMTLQTAFPNARFIFPTAARRRATIYKRAYTHQWFNNWKLDPPATEREELQIDGLAETTKYLHQLLRTEIAIVPGGAKNVVLGGLSQGCAASLIALLLWDGAALGACFGMCGWLPFAESLMGQIGNDRADELHEDGELGFDPFVADVGSTTSEETTIAPAGRAVSWLREELGLLVVTSPSTLLPIQETPIYLGHGDQDERVSISLGRRASECLSQLEGDVCWKEYNGLGHWYSSTMIRDLVNFLSDAFVASHHTGR